MVEKIRRFKRNGKVKIRKVVKYNDKRRVDKFYS